MVIQPAPFPSLGFDTITKLDAVHAAALRDQGFKFAIRYLGSVTAAELAIILDAGLMVSLVTYADRFDGTATVSELTALAIPKGATVWLDVESTGLTTEPLTLAINAWADAVIQGGWQPGLYVGCNQPLNAEQLYQLKVVRYWKSASDVPTPQESGFCLLQLFPTTTVANVEIDVNCIQQDWQGRLPMMIGA